MNTIASTYYQGLYGTSRTALYLIASREGITITREQKRQLNVAGLRDLIARARQTADAQWVIRARPNAATPLRYVHITGTGLVTLVDTKKEASRFAEGAEYRAAADLVGHANLIAFADKA